MGRLETTEDWLSDSYPDFGMIALQQQINTDKRKGGLAFTGNQTNKLVPGKFSDNANPLVAPWLAMPDGAIPLDPAVSINTPAISSMVWSDVIVFTVPNGYDCVLLRYANSYNGGGFTNGSGQLIWRMLRNGQAIRNYENILVQFGVNGLGGQTNGIRLQSGDVFQFQVTNVSLVGASTQITCYVGGYHYPKKIGA